MLYDYYLLGAFSSVVLNKTVNRIVLDKDKRSIMVNKLNMLGYATQKAAAVPIRDVRYTGEVRNDYLTFDNIGLPPSLNKLISLSSSYLEKD